MGYFKRKRVGTNVYDNSQYCFDNSEYYYDMIVAFGIVEFIHDMIVTIVGCIINGVIIWYLFRTNIRAYFGPVKI